MGQVTIYLEQDIESKMSSAAKALNISKSKFIANLIKEKVANEWSNSVKDMAGSWQDFPSLDEIRKTSNLDSPREQF